MRAPIAPNPCQFLVHSIGDVGTTLTFFFEAKAGNIDVSAGTTAEAFVKTLDPGASFATTNEIVQDMTMVPASWGGYMVTLPNLDPALEGQLLQFGFKTRASNFGDSGIFYDNLQLLQTGP